MKEDIIINCPHCEKEIAIIEINCSIFRHGIFKNYEQIPPHSSLHDCENYIKNNQILEGCTKPFRLIYENNKYKAIKCDYI